MNEKITQLPVITTANDNDLMVVEHLTGPPGQKTSGMVLSDLSAYFLNRAPPITLGTTVTLPAGSSATVTITGTPSSGQILSFGIPKGADGAGNVNSTGTPSAGQIAAWTDATHIQGLATTGTGNAVLAATPTLTGTPAAPTAAADTNTTQLATTAFVVAQAGTSNPVIDGTAAPGTSLRYARQDHVHPTDTTRASAASVTALTVRTAVNDAAYTILSTDRSVAMTAITAARIWTLPAASAFPTGTILYLFDESGSASASNTITVTRAGSDTIDGATTAVINSAYGYVVLESNGSAKWTILGQVAAASAGGSGLPSAFLSKSANYTVLTSDKNTLFTLTGSATLTLPSAASMGAGNGIYLSKTDGLGVWAITPTSGTIDGLSSIKCYQERYALVSNGSNWVSVNRPKGWVPITTTTVGSSVAAVIFSTGFLDPELRDMQFNYLNMTTVSTATPQVKVSKNSAYSTTYSGTVLTNSTTTFTNQPATTAIPLGGSVTAGTFTSGTLVVYNINDATVAATNLVTLQGTTAFTTGVMGRVSEGSGVAFAMDALEFIASTGNVNGGLFAQLGYRP